MEKFIVVWCVNAHTGEDAGWFDSKPKKDGSISWGDWWCVSEDPLDAWWFESVEEAEKCLRRLESHYDQIGRVEELDEADYI